MEENSLGLGSSMNMDSGVVGSIGKTPIVQIRKVIPSNCGKIEGIGIGFIPPLWNPGLVNEIITVTTEEAKTMARRLALEEGVFAGASSGANLVAAVRLSQQLGPKSTVVTIMVDSGLRYLSTDLYKHA